MRAEPLLPGVHRLERVLGWGWSQSMLLFELPGGGVLVHSPTWCGEGTFEAIDALGEVRALLGPNHYHHLSLARFRARYPAARAVASEGAWPRLEKQGHRGLGDLAELDALLPAGARAIACAHVKTGETWLAWPAGAARALIVCDGFFAVERPLRGPGGWMLRRMQAAPGLAFGWTYKRLAVADRGAYRAWAKAAIDEVAPRWLVPSHGAVVEDGALAARLGALLDRRC